MPNEALLNIHLHELFSYLGQAGVTSVLTLAQHSPFTEGHAVAEVSYLADAVLLLRYFEAIGEVRKAISVIKKRTGKHERTIRELIIDGGLNIGHPIREFQGVMSGSPALIDKNWAERSGERTRDA